MVRGVAGIGKTALCIKFYSLQIEKNKEFVMPFIDLSECRTIEEFTKAVSLAFGMKDNFIELDDILNWITAHRREYDAFFFDNWEDIQISLQGKREWDCVCNFVNNIKELGFKILISSQEVPPLEWKELPLDTLNDKQGKQLFKQLLLRKGKKVKAGDRRELDAFNDLLRNMENHPLTIVLTASLVEGKYDSLSRIKQMWSDVCDKTADQRHISMKVALEMSYNSVQSIAGAKELWGIIAMLNTDFPMEFIELLSEFKPDICWEAAQRKLYSRSLIVHNASHRIHMLNTVKLQWEKLVDGCEFIECIRMWGEFLTFIVKQSDASRFTHDPKKSNRLREPVLFCMSGFIRIIERLIQEKEFKIAESCVNAIYDYYELVGMSALTFLQKIPLEQMSKDTKGMINKWLGDISRLGKKEKPEIALGYYEEALKWLESNIMAKAEVLNNIGQNYLWSYRNPQMAMEYFERAERLLQPNKADKVLAMILKNKGIVLAEWDNDYELAKECYDKAEKLYRKIGDYRGIAHTIKRKGVIEWKKTHYEYAINHFEKAIKYYKDVHYVQGVGDSMSRMCQAYMKIENEIELKKIIKEGRKLIDVIPYQITKTDLVNSLNSAQNWIDEHDEEKMRMTNRIPPMKWIKHMVLCYFKLRDKDEIERTIHRFEIKNYQCCLEQIAKDMRNQVHASYVIKLVYQSRFYKLPNLLISCEDDIEKCKMKLKEESVKKYAEIWYCANYACDLRAYGRILIHLNEMFPNLTERKIEMVWAKSARKLEEYPHLSCSFISITTKGWGANYLIDDLIVGEKSKEDLILIVDRVLTILPKYYNEIVELGNYLIENGCSYLCLEFSFLEPAEFSIIDWDSDNDESVLKAFKNMEAVL